MTRELQEHRASIRHLEDRLRDLETAVKLLAQEQRHAREFEAASREKLLLQIQQELGKRKALLVPKPPRKKK